MDYFIDFVYIYGGFKNFTNPYTKEEFETWIEHENSVGNRIVMIKPNHARVYIEH